MSISQPVITNLIQSTRRIDPTLADLLLMMNNELKRISVIIDPPPTPSISGGTADLERPRDITVFSYAFTGTNILLFWEPPQEGFLMYEIRTNSSSFSDGIRVTAVAGLSIILDPSDSFGVGPVGAVGSHFYTIKAFNAEGEESANEAVLEVIVPALGLININPNVINNQVILTWNEPTSTFDINHYEIYKNGNLIQDNVRGTFYVIQEIAGGSFTYGIKAVDIAGNQSMLSTVTLDVNDPSDYEIQNEFESDFSGTKVNTLVENDDLLACINVTETYENHFLSRFWNSPQNQVDAGFPLFIQPAAASGSYVEVFDFGSNFSNNIISYSWVHETLAGSVTISVSTRTSLDAMAWSAPQAGTQIFVAGPMRYVEVTLTFTSSL